MLKTTDGGETWRLLDNGLDEDVHAIIVDPRDTRRLYISSGGEGMRSGKAPGRSLYRSLDGGESWLPIALEFENEYSVGSPTTPPTPRSCTRRSPTAIRASGAPASPARKPR